MMMRPVTENVTHRPPRRGDEVERACSFDASARRRRPSAEERRRACREPADAGLLPVGRQPAEDRVAKWLVKTPTVLLADEPTRGIDVGAKRAIYELINELAVQGLGVLLISSELEEVLGLAHRVLVVRAGRIVAELDGDQADEETVMRAAFGGAGSDAPAGEAA